ncbi:hypothetical protein B0H13DRAFT_2365202 [Mycena leptocephala]|nr:hypothetical protein B0H13DRAFT_2365202 [Mycena leptocephala]
MAYASRPPTSPVPLLPCSSQLTSEVADPRCPTPLPPSQPIDIPTPDRRRAYPRSCACVTPMDLDLTPCTYASAPSLSAQLRLVFRLSHAPALVAPPLPQLWLSLPSGWIQSNPASYLARCIQCDAIPPAS